MQSSAGLPTLILTGASGLLGKYLLEEFKNEFRIFAIARRSQYECNAPRHPNIAWMRADIADISSITKTFSEIQTAGGADFLIHLAAYYDFENEYHLEYQRTNINGTANIIQLAKNMKLKLFVFASSVAACSFPAENEFVDEDTPADGEHIYAKSKKAGEEMVKNFAGHTPSCIIRLGAIFSDWCEYAPLYMQINTWIGNSPKSKIVAGHGNSSVPYVHVRDVLRFMRELLYHYGMFNSGETLVVSTNGSTSHLQLYKLITHYFFGNELKPVLLPKFVCAFGIYLLIAVKFFLHINFFEKPWMLKYIDKKLDVKIKRTDKIIDWSPDPRLHIEKRMPFIIERMKSEPLTWQLRNSMILRKSELRIDFVIYSVLADDEDIIIDKIIDSINTANDQRRLLAAPNSDSQEIMWFVKFIYRLILTSINTNNKLLIQNYFEASSVNRFETGFNYESIAFILRKIEEGIIDHLSSDERLNKSRKELYDFISLPIDFAIDEAEQQYHLYIHNITTNNRDEIQKQKYASASARELLEETIWSCLVNRK
ncbi:MAG: NAD(P)-dependent oxidoreductase [Bacteroidota bacterium]